MYIIIIIIKALNNALYPWAGSQIGMKPELLPHRTVGDIESEHILSCLMRLAGWQSYNLTNLLCFGYVIIKLSRICFAFLWIRN